MLIFFVCEITQIRVLNYNSQHLKWIKTFYQIIHEFHEQYPFLF